MKECPFCRSKYTDASLKYCLSDGSALVDLDNDGEETVSRGRPGPPVRIDLGSTGEKTAVLPTRETQTTAPASSGSGIFLKIAIALLGLGLLAIVLVGMAGFIYYKSQAGVATNTTFDPPNRQQTRQSPAPSSTSDDTQELRDQIANLEKQLKQQQTSNRPANIPLSLPDQNTTTTARVNSPGDGFLALRTYPSSDVGDRILKIPHGSTIIVGGCINASRVGGKSGRWCRASYNGYSGWVFDAFLIY